MSRKIGPIVGNPQVASSPPNFISSFIRMLMSFIPQRSPDESKVLDYDIKKALFDRGLFYLDLFSESQQQSKSSIPRGSTSLHYFAHLMILINFLRLMSLSVISDQNIIIFLGDGGMLFGQSRIPANVCFGLIYGSAWGTTLVCRKINLNPSRGIWMRFYFDSHSKTLWTSNVEEWQKIRAIVNFMYIFNTFSFSYFFFLTNSSVFLSPLIVYSNSFDSNLQVFFTISCIIAQIAEFFKASSQQFGFFFFNSYCMITKFRLERIMTCFDQLNEAKNFPSSQIRQCIGQYLKVYKEVENANYSLSSIIGALYSATFLLALLSIFISVFSNSTGGAKFVFGSLSVATIMIGVCGTCITGSAATGSVS